MNTWTWLGHSGSLCDKLGLTHNDLLTGIVVPTVFSITKKPIKGVNITKLLTGKVTSCELEGSVQGSEISSVQIFPSYRVS